MFQNYSFLKSITVIPFIHWIHPQLRLSFQIGLVMRITIQYSISLDLVFWNQLKSPMIVSDQYQHSESMDWINYTLSKSARIHLLTKRMEMEKTNQNYSTYWIVNHWNRLKLVSIVSVISLETLNWRIYHNYNPFKLEQLEVNQKISFIILLWFEVLIWYWIFDWLDLPNLQSITLGNYAFQESFSTKIEGIEWIWMKWFE